jgi:hypothetical protein
MPHTSELIVGPSPEFYSSIFMASSAEATITYIQDQTAMQIVRFPWELRKRES